MQRAKDHLFQTHSAWWFSRNLLEPIPQFDLPLPVRISQDPSDRVIDYMKGKKYLSEEEFRIGQENGHWFLGLFVDHEVKGFCKCGFRKVFLYDTHSILSLSEGMSFIYEYEVDESLRGKGAGKYLMAAVLKMFVMGGWKYAFCHIPPKNMASIKVVESCGFRKVELVRFTQIAGFKWKSRNIEDLLERALRY